MKRRDRVGGRFTRPIRQANQRRRLDLPLS
jgi:hypothetical protein